MFRKTGEKLRKKKKEEMCRKYICLIDFSYLVIVTKKIALGPSKFYHVLTIHIYIFDKVS